MSRYRRLYKDRVAPYRSWVLAFHGPTCMSCEWPRSPGVYGVKLAHWQRRLADWTRRGWSADSFIRHRGDRPMEPSLEIDHVIPLAKGGATEPENLQVLCSYCNASKGGL